MHIDEPTPVHSEPRVRLGVEPDGAELARVQALLESRLLGLAVERPRLGRFILLERIGAGGMGVVYAAYDDKLDRKVAVKLLHAELDTPMLRERLVREAQAMAKLSHPNVAAVFEIGEQDGRALVAMELVDGQTLRKWGSEHARTPTEIVAVYLQAARGLAAAHAAGIVHRDFKPDNALVDRDGRVRVLDFGLAVQRGATEPSIESQSSSDDAATSSLTRTGALVGTPAYMAPEQIGGEPADARSDQFAFCVSLWEALSGARPYEGRTTTELLEAVQRGQIGGARRMPAWIEAILRRGLSADPRARHPDMHALVRALEQDPAQKRRVRAVLAIAVLAIPALWIGATVRDRMHARACADEANAIDELWNADAEARVREGLLASGAGNATTTADKAMPSLTEHAERWRAQAEQACLARRDPRNAAVPAPARDACIERSRVAFATLIDTLATADRDVVQRTIAAIGSLPRPEACAEPGEDGSAGEPTDAATLAAVRRLENELVASESLQRAGRYDLALSRAEAVLTEASALQWLPTIAKARYRIAVVAGHLGDHARAAHESEEAFYEAATADLDAVAARAALSAYWTVGYRLQRADEADRWERLADVFIARFDDPRPGIVLERETNVGHVHNVRGDLDDAKAHFERALELAETSLGPVHEETARVLLGLAEVQLRTGEHDAARAAAMRAEAIVDEVLGPDHPVAAAVATVLAWSDERRGELQSALALHRRALALREQAFGPVHFDVANNRINLSNCLAHMGDDAEAEREIVRALGVFEHRYAAQPMLAIVLGNLANARYRAGDFRSSRAFAARALALGEVRLGATHPETGRLATVLGNAEEALGEYRAAREHLELGLAITESTFGPDHLAVAHAVGNLANVELDMGETIAARDHYARSLAILERTVAPDDIVIAYALTGLGWTHAKLGETAAARAYLTRALELRERGLPKDHPLVAQALGNLADVESTAEDHEHAVAHARRAVAIFASAHHPDLAYARARAETIERAAKAAR